MKKLYMVLSVLALVTSSCIFADVTRVTTEGEYTRLANNGRPVVIEFSANWCGVCNGIAKPFEELSMEPEFKDVTFARIDIDELSDLSEKRGITGVPTFVFFESGREKKCDVGVKNLGAFKENFRRCLRGTFSALKNSSKMDPTNGYEAWEDPEFTGSPEKINTSTSSLWHTIENVFFKILDFIQGFFNFVINGIKSLFGR